MSVFKVNSLLSGILIAMVLPACNYSKPQGSKSDIWVDTLKYSYQRVQLSGDKGHNALIISYPAFKSQQALNDTVMTGICKLFNLSNGPGIQALAAAFKAKADPAKPKSGLKLEENADVIRQDSSLLIIQTSGSNSSGTPQPVKRTVFINWNVKAQQTIVLSDILTDGALPQLNKIAEAIFRKQENLKDTSSLAHDYKFVNAKFALNGNFSIMPIGLNFVYNPGEIKPNGAGITDLLIPYSSIKKILRPNTVVTRYIQ